MFLLCVTVGDKDSCEPTLVTYFTMVLATPAVRFVAYIMANLYQRHMCQRSIVVAAPEPLKIREEYESRIISLSERRVS